MRNYSGLILGAFALALGMCGLVADARPIHGGIAASGGGGSQITTLLMQNTSGSTVSNQPVTLLIPLGPTAMTTSDRLQIRKNDSVTVVASVQQDKCATFKQNGNQKLCAVSFVEPDSLAPATTTTYQVWKTPGSPVTTPNVSTANITGNTNFVFKTSFNLVPGNGTGTAETGIWDLMDVNYVLSNACPAWSNSTGWGADPACGWEITATGGSKYGLHLFMYAKRESDNAIHKWLRTDFWIDFWGSGSTPCPCSVSAKVSIPNIYGPLASGTVGAGGGGYVLGADLYNGATRIPVNFGGPNDSRSANVTFDHTYTDFAGTIGGAVFPGGAWVGNTQVQSQVFGIAFSTSGGTLPSALTANQPYFITLVCRDINFCAPPSLTKFSIYNWQLGPRDNDGNVTPHVTLTDDGSCSSNCTAFPVVRVNPWGGTVLASTTGGRFWIGAGGTAMTEPPVQAEENFTYLTQTTHAVPPYLTNLWGNFPAQSGMTNYGAIVYYPNTSILYGDYNTGGDGAGDTRIGQIDNFGAIALYAPFDKAAFGNSRIYAAGQEQDRGYMIDEHTGLLAVMNHGHDKAGSIYPHMGTTDNSAIFNSRGGCACTGFPVMVNGWTGPSYWTGSGDLTVHNRYQPILESSHMPMPAQAPYVLTGLPEYLDQMQSEADGFISGVGATVSLNSVTYYRALSKTNDLQTRGVAWGRRIIDQADYFTPDTDVVAQYLSDLVTEDFAFDAAMISGPPGTISGGLPVGGVTSYEAALGYLWGDVRSASVGQTGNGEFQPWMDDYVFQVTALEKLRGEYGANVTTTVNYVGKFAFGRMDSNVGGCLWAGPTRLVSPFAPLTTYDNYFDFTTLAPDWLTFYQHSSADSRTFTGTLSGNTLTVTALGSYGSIANGIVPANAGVPWIGGSVIVGPGVPANTTVLSGTYPTFTVSGAGGSSSGPFVREYAGGYSGNLNFGGINPGAPPWAGCATNSAVTPITTDTTQSSADGPNSLISIATSTLAYATWLGYTGADTDYDTFRNIEYLGTNPNVDHNTGTTIPLSFYSILFQSRTSSNAAFAVGPLNAHYP